MSHVRHENSVLNQIADWKLEAKLEDNNRYFKQIPEVSRIENGSRCYVIGRKGTGKTAASEFFLKKTSHNCFTEKLSFKNFPFNDLYELKNNRYTHPNQYITLWKYIIYSSIAKLMSTNEAISTDLTSNLRKVYQANLNHSLARTIANWTSRTFSFNILGTGMSAAASNAQSANTTSWVERVELLEDFIHANVDDSNYYIIFDELDEDYNDMTRLEKNTEYTALLTGLFKAVQDIRAVFNDQRFKIYPIVFLRDDIYDLLTDSDKTKWNDLKIDIDWDRDKIKELLAFRISRSVSSDAPLLQFSSAWGKVFSNNNVAFGHMQKKEMSAFDFITRSTLGRPRDYIAYLQLCAEAATKADSARISPTLVRGTDKAFSNYLRSELQDEIRGIFPDAKAIFDIISHIRKQKFSFNEFAEHYKEAANRKNVEDRDVEMVLNILFYFSVIGNQPTQKNTHVFRYINKEARINFKEPFCVHRGLFKALQIL